ncbi:MAG: DUF4845 domain-containing protein [Gammaproteobacteria bacterium]|nr:DUF4845 domain-containing protein [Gammaproteobacteria bacterium]
MLSKKNQAGVTAMGWLVILGLIAFFALLTLKIVPVYLEHYSIKSVVTSLKDEQFISKKSKKDISTMILTRVRINGVYDMDPDSITIKKNGGTTNVDVTYSVQKNIIGNVDVLISFSDQVDLVPN